MNDQRKALVIGATGGVGGETARALLRHGWHVRGLVRDASRPNLAGDIQWHEGDAMNAADVAAAAQGVQVIVHAVNPPGYKDWEKKVLPMIDHTIAAARAGGARIVLPGTVYNYGPDALPRLVEDSPQHPKTRKGAIRVQLEQRLQAAAKSGVPALILRCGDFFGPQLGNSWFSTLVKPVRPIKAIQYPGATELRHAWAYLPDVGETIAQLLEHEGELKPFARFHFGGHWVDGDALAASIARGAGAPHMKVKPVPWWLMTLASPFVTVLREVCEMRYLWQLPLQLDNARLVDLLGSEPHTPLDEAVRATLDGQAAA